MAKIDLKKLTKQLLRNEILVPHINTYQNRGQFPETWNVEIRNTKAPDPYFHPSGDTYTSPKQLYLEKTGQASRNSINFALRRVFDCGHFWHGYYQNIITEMGFVKPENVERTFTVERRNFTARGTVDLFEVDIPNSGKWIVDLKTMSDTEYDAGPREETYKKWKAQLCCYADWSGCKNIMILAVRKGATRNPIEGMPQHDLKEYIIDYDPDLVEEIYDRWELAQKYIQGELEVE